MPHFQPYAYNFFSAFVLGKGITLGKECLLQEAVDMKISVGVCRGVDSSLQ